MSSSATASSSSSTSTMKTWMDERPFEVMIEQDISLPPRTVKDYHFDFFLPASKYDYVADMIQRDPNIFKSDFTIYDQSVWKLEYTVPRLKKELEKIQKEFETVTNKDVLHELILKERELTIEKRKSEEHLAYYTALQEISRKEFVTLNRIAKIYKEKGDFEFLRKGAHWAGTQSELRISKIKVPDELKK